MNIDKLLELLYKAKNTIGGDANVWWIGEYSDLSEVCSIDESLIVDSDNASLAGLYLGT